MIISATVEAGPVVVELVVAAAAVIAAVVVVCSSCSGSTTYATYYLSRLLLTYRKKSLALGYRRARQRRDRSNQVPEGVGHSGQEAVLRS